MANLQQLFEPLCRGGRLTPFENVMKNDRRLTVYHFFNIYFK